MWAREFIQNLESIFNSYLIDNNLKTITSCEFEYDSKWILNETSKLISNNYKNIYSIHN